MVTEALLLLLLVSCSLDRPNTLGKVSGKPYRCLTGVPCVCFDELGCFLNRAECGEGRDSLLPQSPNDIRTKFLLFTSKSQGTGTTITYDMTKGEFLNAGFDPTKETKFVIHGFINSADSVAVEDIKDAFLAEGSYNIIMVDWAAGADIGLVDIIKFWTIYRQASQNTRVVAKQLHLLLERMHSEIGAGFNYGRNVHVIGHSLGAQTAGLAAAYLGGQVGRISGLDPAKPNFEGKDRVCRLDESDALFVDVIHTDIDYFGTAEQSGDIDFFPNGGSNQPGCGIELLGCSHGRSLEFYAISIEGACQYLSQPCDDTTCNTDCPAMGIYADKSSKRGNFCLTTLPDKPYC